MSYLGRLAPEVTPNRGVAAGCSMATTMVKIYVLLVFDAFVAAHPAITFNAYIDDFKLSACGRRCVSLPLLIDAGRDLARRVTDDLHAALAPKKAACVASNLDIVRLLRRALGPLGGPSIPSAISLGIDFTAGAPATRGGGRS